MSSWANLGIMTLVGTIGGLLGWKFKIPGGIIVFSMLAVMLYNYFVPSSQNPPLTFTVGVQILLGVMLGAAFHPDLMELIRKNLFFIFLSGVGSIICGFAICLILIKWGHMDAASAYLATSPGAMSGMVALAAEMDANLALVLTCHLVRIYLVLLTVPLVLRLLRIWL